MSHQAAGMHNSEGVNVDLYIPRKWCERRPCVCRTCPPPRASADPGPGRAASAAVSRAALRVRASSVCPLRADCSQLGDQPADRGQGQGQHPDQHRPRQSYATPTRCPEKCLERRYSCNIKLHTPQLTRTARASAADGVYTGEFTTMAMCGFIRAMGEGDGCLDRLWTKCYEESKGSI